jgi:hypothetical protein
MARHRRKGDRPQPAGAHMVDDIGKVVAHQGYAPGEQILRRRRRADLRALHAPARGWRRDQRRGARSSPDPVFAAGRGAPYNRCSDWTTGIHWGDPFGCKPRDP